jgi:predicted NAD/FAD-dependent oxidoreductase
MSGTVVIGAGIAGLTCARALVTAGESVLVVDKGRGIGGRMATRRVDRPEGELRFDHGAQYVTARDPAFAALLEGMPRSVAVWDDGAEHPHHVGLPGMSGLVHAMAANLDVRRGMAITEIHPATDKWQVMTSTEVFEASRVILTVPSPQVAALIGANHPLVPSLEPVEIAPCLTLMAAFPLTAAALLVSRKQPDHPLAFIARDSSKPGRPQAATTWVAQASPDWSAEHLEEDKAQIADRMLPLLCQAIGADPETALHMDAHRWRYARVITPLGKPFLRDGTGTLYLGGDWCLGPRVEAAWTSGLAIAQDILGHDYA